MVAIAAADSTEEPYRTDDQYTTYDNIDQLEADAQSRFKRTPYPNPNPNPYAKNFDIQVVKKSGRLRQIHLYPYQQKKIEATQQPTSQDIYTKTEEQETADTTHAEKLVAGPGYDQGYNGKDNAPSDSTTHYIKEHKEKIKIKHHHHHHHHNHVKTVVKKEPYPVEKIVHVPKPYPVDKIVEKVVHVPKPYPVEKVWSFYIFSDEIYVYTNIYN